VAVDRQRLFEALFAAAALSFLAIGCFLVLRPFLSALMWAVILCYASWPGYTWLEPRLGGRRTLTAIVMTAAVGAVLVVPFVIVGFTLVENVSAWVQAIKDWVARGLPTPPDWVTELPVIGAELAQRWQALSSETGLMDAVRVALNPLRDAAIAAGSLIGRGTVELGFSVFIAFFVFRRGDEMALGLRQALTRLIGPRARQFIEVAGGTIQGVVYGILGTALAQGLLAGIGFTLVSIPGALFLGLLTFFMSLIPMGPPFVWVPTVIWLISIERYGAAVFMAIWGTFVISGIDNIIKPYLISRGSQMPFVLVFLGVIGGVLAFGFLGVFLGPVLLAVGYTLLLAWNRGEKIEGEALPADAVSTPASTD
jgi:predicted PurR-regulated permease PerM